MPTMPMPPAIAAPPGPEAEDGDPFGGSDLPASGEKNGPQATLHWVSLDARTGRLLCPSLGLGLDVDCLTGRITQKRLVRVFGDGHDERDEEEQEQEEEETGALCASSNCRVADHGRPGRECAWCEDLSVCAPR